MFINEVFSLTMMLDSNSFYHLFSKVNFVDQDRDEYVDQSMVSKGITVIYRPSQYKKKIRLIINTHLMQDDISDTDKLIRKLDKRISEYFNHKYCLEDFVLSGANLATDIDVGNQKAVSAYLKVIKRVGKVKGFSPCSYDSINSDTSFCLSGNSNNIDFLLYDLTDWIKSTGIGYKQKKSVSGNTEGIIRAEVQLTKPKAIRAYTDAASTSIQIVELSKKRQGVFMDTFTHIVPFGDFYKKDKATEIIRREVKDSIMRRKMLRLLYLIPEKKSLHLAQKAMNCRDIEKVMDAFAKINLSPITISKRDITKHLENIYTFLL